MRSLHAHSAPPSYTESIESAQVLSSMVPRGHSCISGVSLCLSHDRGFSHAGVAADQSASLLSTPCASLPRSSSLVHRMIAMLINCVAEKASAHSRDIYSVAFSPDGTKIVSGGRDGTIKVWDSGAPRAQNCPLLGQN